MTKVLLVLSIFIQGVILGVIAPTAINPPGVLVGISALFVICYLLIDAIKKENQ